MTSFSRHFIFLYLVLFFTAAPAQTTGTPELPAQPKEKSVNKTWVKPTEGLKPSTKKYLLMDRTIWFGQNDLTSLPVRDADAAFNFEDASETRSGFGVWWCANYLGTNTFPNRVMFLAGLNNEGDYLLYFFDRSSGRAGSTQRFSPEIFKQNPDGTLTKLSTEKSNPKMHFTPKYKDKEMTSVAFEYTSNALNDYKIFTRENCARY